MGNGNVILSNAFSINMIQLREGEIKVSIRRINIEQAKEILKSGFISVIGHQATAQILTELLGVNVPINRQEIKLQQGQELVVFQLLTRLPEGKVLSNQEVKQLLDEGKIAFFLVQLV